MRHRISPATTIASAALFFSLTGAGMAASHYLITSTRQIAPSVQRALRGAVGPQGVQGATGPQGAAGAQGAQGIAGSVDFSTATHAGGSVTLLPTPTGRSGVAYATCPAGTYVIDGGFSTSGATVTSAIAASRNEWTITATIAPDTTQAVVYAYAECVS